MNEGWGEKEGWGEREREREEREEREMEERRGDERKREREERSSVPDPPKVKSPQGPVAGIWVESRTASGCIIGCEDSVTAARSLYSW